MPSPPEDEPERPRAVAVIGWTWLVLGTLAFLKNALDLIVWFVIRPAIPSLIGMMPQNTSSPQLRVLLEHLGELRAAEALLALFFVISAIAFLRYRPWARVAIQVACVLELLYIAGLGAVWWFSFTSEMAEARIPIAASYRVALAAGFVFLALLVAGIVAMFTTLRSARFRELYRRNSALF